MRRREASKNRTYFFACARDGCNERTARSPPRRSPTSIIERFNTDERRSFQARRCWIFNNSNPYFPFARTTRVTILYFDQSRPSRRHRRRHRGELLIIIIIILYRKLIIIIWYLLILLSTVLQRFFFLFSPFWLSGWLGWVKHTCV